MLVKESISFQRYKDPKEALGLVPSIFLARNIYEGDIDKDISKYSLSHDEIQNLLLNDEVCILYGNYIYGGGVKSGFYFYTPKQLKEEKFNVIKYENELYYL